MPTWCWSVRIRYWLTVLSSIKVGTYLLALAAHADKGVRSTFVVINGEACPPFLPYVCCESFKQADTTQPHLAMDIP